LDEQTGIFNVAKIAEDYKLTPTAAVTQNIATGINVNSGTLALISKGDGTIQLDYTIQTLNVGTSDIIMANVTDADLLTNTGDPATDIYTVLATDTTLGAKVHTVTVTDNLVMYIRNCEIFNLNIYNTADQNIASDRYNYWNPDWPLINKKFYLNRHKIKGLPATGLCVNIDGSNTDNIARFIGRTI